MRQDVTPISTKKACARRFLAAILATLLVVLGALRPAQAYAADGETAPQTAAAEEGSLETLLLESFVRRSTEPIDVERFGMGVFELNKVYNKVLCEHPELFDVQLNWTNSQSSGDVITSITPCYQLANYDDEQVFEMRARMSRGIADAMSWIPVNGSELDKAKAAHDWLCSHVRYDRITADERAATGGFNNVPTAYGLILSNHEPFYANCAYGAFAECYCVCQGYAEAFRLLMDKVGVQCVDVTAHGHEWNLVKVDGDWYHVDATWDSMRWDPKLAPFEQRLATDNWVDINYDMYFMKSDQGIIESECLYHEDEPDYTPIHSDFMALGAGAATNTRYDTTTANNWDGVEPHPGVQPQNQVTDFKLSQESLDLEAHQVAQLEVTGLDPVDANPFMAVWRSDNPTVASVCSDGTVLAMSESGVATISCTINGCERTCTVSVRANADGEQGTQGPDVEPAAKEPKFLEPSVDCTGKIGIRMPVELPVIKGADWDASYLSYSVDGKSARKARIDFASAEVQSNKGGARVAWFTIPLSSIEMAQTVLTSFNYCQGSELRTIDAPTCTLESIVRKNERKGTITELERCIVNFGYYVQKFCAAQNKWTLDDGYRGVSGCFSYGYEPQSVLSELADANMSKRLGGSNVKNIAMSMHFQSDVTVDIDIYLKKAGSLSASASFNGKTYQATKVSGTCYRISVPGITAQHLGDTIELSGTAGGDFSATMTPMSYAKAVLTKSLYGKAGDDAMAALHYYRQLVR